MNECPFCAVPLEDETTCPACENCYSNWERESELLMDGIGAAFTHVEFSGGCYEKANHHALNHGIAPISWPGWKFLRPPLGKACACTLIGMTSGRAVRAIASGEGFDLAKGIPSGGGRDRGWAGPREE